MTFYLIFLFIETLAFFGEKRNSNNHYNRPFVHLTQLWMLWEVIGCRSQDVVSLSETLGKRSSGCSCRMIPPLSDFIREFWKLDELEKAWWYHVWRFFHVYSWPSSKYWHWISCTERNCTTARVVMRTDTYSLHHAAYYRPTVFEIPQIHLVPNGNVGMAV